VPVYVPRPDLDPARVVTELGMTVAGTYADLETRLIARVAAILSEGWQVTPDLDTRLPVARRLREAAEEAVGRVDPGMAEDILAIAARRGTIQAAEELGLAPRTGFRF